MIAEPFAATGPATAALFAEMLLRSVAQQFDGALSYDWKPTGLVVTLRMRKDRLAA